jgi:uncharacterized protein (DUF433 family)
VESVPGRLSGAWVFKDTRMPVSTVFENLEAGATIDEIMEWFDVTREQIVTVLEFAACSLDPPNPPARETRTLTSLDEEKVNKGRAFCLTTPR